MAGLQAWGLVSEEWQDVIEWFTSRDDAERALADVLSDEPDWENVIRVREFRVDASGIELAE